MVTSVQLTMLPSRICLKGVLRTPFILSTYDGNFDIQEEKFYTIGVMYYFVINTTVLPWKIEKAIKVR